MSLQNNHPNDDIDIYGDDSLFADFDPDECVANHRSNLQQMQQKQQQSNHVQLQPTFHIESSSAAQQQDHVNSVNHKRDISTLNANENPHVSDDTITTSIQQHQHVKRPYQVSGLPTVITEDQSQALRKTLFDYFGHSSFRTGQLEIISSLVYAQKDAAFFCPTGKGKSLCYQLPPLFLNKIAIVISPLISLMQDQVLKLNSLSVLPMQNRRRKIATYLGTGQTDAQAEIQAVQGQYSLVYCTPEKLVGNISFLQALADLHVRTKDICLFAIDESHCVSEWGHDFRPQYRKIGDTLRTHPILKQIPILALTATAVPRVQTDILTSLCFRPADQSHVVTQTIDRPNLSLQINRKPTGGFKAALSSLAEDLSSLIDKKAQLAFGSTIIYAPTQNLVDEISYWLQSSYSPATDPWVLPYHAGLSLPQRSQAHTNFLVGKTKVIVATVAFGMGIDKPDIRRIIHFGAPGTMEDYYQQIGRCGRDGLESLCTMFCNEADFVAYKSSFYVGSLPVHVKIFREESINAFRNFCMSDESCRRAKLLEYFGQTISFEGGRCGTCDTCKNRVQNASDLERDFANDGARLVLYAISVLKEKSSTTTIESVLSGKVVEKYRYRSNAIDPMIVNDKITTMKTACTKSKRWPVAHFTKGFLPSLVNAGFLQKIDVSSQNHAGMKYTSTWVGYDLTAKGKAVLEVGAILLPVPAFIREIEMKETAENRSRIALLENAGVDIAQIPPKELEVGDGEVIRSLETWYRYLENLGNRGKSDYVNSLDDLRMRIESWRSDMALQYQIAPSVVMAEHMLFSIAYMAATLPKNAKVEHDALVATGLRIGNIKILVETLDQWRAETLAVQKDDTRKSDIPIPLPPDPFRPSSPWKWSEYKPNKKTGLPVWEISYNRFMAGEHPQTIAMTQSSGKPIQAATVASHLLTALTNGRTVPLRRVAEVMPLPTITEWNLLALCECETQIDVCDNPKTSGVNGSAFTIKDFLVPILGNAFALKEFSERTVDEQEKFSKYCNLLNWYVALRRAGFKLDV